MTVSLDLNKMGVKFTVFRNIHSLRVLQLLLVKSRSSIPNDLFYERIVFFIHPVAPH